MRTYIASGWLTVILLALASLSVAERAQAETQKPKYKPALIYLYSGEDTDSAFINSARIGIEKAQNEFHVPVTVTRMSAAEDISAVIKRVADSGASPIIALGNQYVAPVLNLAERYPRTNFTVIDGLVPPLYPNVQSILFKDHEGAFLIGLIAGKTTKTDFVGFVGGMDLPIIRNFAQGYTQGVKYANADVAVHVQMTGTTPDAWSNPEQARSIALTQYREGADVIFAAAGGSSIGVLKAADEMGKLAIGVDTNQNGLYPGHVLTSLVKRVDIAVYDSLKNSVEGSWNPGIKYLGIKEGALDYAVDQNNRSLISEKLIEEVATAKDKIISGKITVEQYTPK
ncbi:MAG: BMP family ABC transporter substrate-binding protein [Pseudomonadota bacterium]